MDDQSTNPSDMVTLDYGAKPNPWRKRGRWAIRFLLLAGLIFAGWRWGPPAWRQATLLHWQRQCLNYSPPPDMVIYEADPAAAKALLRRPGYSPVDAVRTDSSTNRKPTAIANIAAYRPEPWDALLQRGVFAMRQFNSGRPQMTAICFMGELQTPAGERRLVVVECAAWWQVPQPGLESAALTTYSFTPAGAFGALTNLVDSRGFMGLGGLNHVPSDVRVFAGQRDPNDPSRFTIRYQAYGQENIVDGSIDNAGRVKVMPRQPLPKPINPPQAGPTTYP